MRIRRQTAEHPFGTIKAWMGATHFSLRTLEKVSAEMSLHVLAYNLKWMIAILGVQPLIQAIRARLSTSPYMPSGSRSRARRKHVDPNLAGREVEDPAAGEIADCRLAGAVDAEGRDAGRCGSRASQDNRAAIFEKRQRLLDCEESALHVDVKNSVEMLFGNLPKRGELAAARIGEQNVDRACFVLHHRKEPVEIGEVRDIALDAAGIVPDLGDRGSSSFWRRPVMNTRAPSAAKRFAEARPMPLLAPVITATFPSSLPTANLPSCRAPSAVAGYTPS